MAAGTSVKYVCLSDTHFGEPASLLSQHGSDAFRADVLTALVDFLRDIVSDQDDAERPCLILNGDIVDLAFSSLDVALEGFQRLVQLIADGDGPPLFSKIIYIPGNHDHHLWEMSRESLYVNALLAEHGDQPVRHAEHATGILEDNAIPSYLFNKAGARAVRDKARAPEVVVSYPNLALQHDLGRTVVFHHGHYVESLYSFFSNARMWFFPDRTPPQTVHELEAENFAWIDFVWSLLGRSGEAGKDAQTVFRTLHTPERARELIDRVVKRIVATVDIPFVPGAWLESKVLRVVIRRFLKNVSPERYVKKEAHDAELALGIERYLRGPVFRQLEDETGSVPRDFTFVFGHTHKPFEDVARVGEAKVRLHNTGGWTVEPGPPRRAHGAAVVLVSDTLDVCSVRLLRERGEAEENVVRIAPDAPSSTSRFRDELCERLFRSDASLSWSRLQEVLALGIEERRQHWRERYPTTIW